MVSFRLLRWKETYTIAATPFREDVYKRQGADRAVGIAGLTKTAAPDTAPEQLQHDPVMHNLGGGNDGLDRKIGLVHVLYDPLGDRGRSAVPGRDGGHSSVLIIGHIIEGCDIDPGTFGLSLIHI